MLNIICHIDENGLSTRYSLKIIEGSTVQQLIDKIQQRFSESLSKIQRNDRIQGPANILFTDELIENSDEFWLSFDRSSVGYFWILKHFWTFRV